MERPSGRRLSQTTAVLGCAIAVLITLSAAAPVFAANGNASPATCCILSGRWTDNFNEAWSLKATGVVAHYAISGRVRTSCGAYYVTGTGSDKTFILKFTPVCSGIGCSVTFSGSFVTRTSAKGTLTDCLGTHRLFT